MNNAMHGYYKAEALSVRNRALIIPEKSIPDRKKFCMYVVSIVAYQAYQDRCRPHKIKKRKKLDFHTRGTETMAVKNRLYFAALF